MTPEQVIERLARVDERSEQIMEALKEMKQTLHSLPTHSDLKMYATTDYVKSLEKRLEELQRSSPKAIATSAQYVVLWLAALAGLANLVLQWFK